MWTKEKILERTEHLKRISPSEAQGQFPTLEDAINAYFEPTTELEQLVGACVFQVAYNIEYRETEYEKPEVMPKFSEDLPKGYSDVRVLFDGGGVFDEMEEVPDDEFLGNYDVLLLDWTERLKEATAERLANLEAINAFCENDATNNGIAVYFEQPVLMSQPDRRKIAKKVYIDGGYLEIIKTFGFGTHIPSYLKDE